MISKFDFKIFILPKWLTTDADSTDLTEDIEDTN